MRLSNESSNHFNGTVGGVRARVFAIRPPLLRLWGQKGSQKSNISPRFGRKEDHLVPQSDFP